MANNILIVEDEPAIAENVIYALRTEGYAPVWKTLGSEALACLKAQTIDAVILDVGLPDVGGFELCKAIRQFSQVPIIFVTARGEEIDRVVGLEIGADDYVVKPFSPRELVARVKTVLRRTRAGTSEEGAGLFKFDAARARVTYAGVALELTRYELLLLKAMLAQPERLFSRAQLMERLDAAPASMERTIDTHVKTLRAKLRQITPDFDPIQTHRGMGYSLQTHRP